MSTPLPVKPLPATRLRRTCSLSSVPFKTTADVHPAADGAAAVENWLGQERAVSALDFGVSMARPGYNLYVVRERDTAMQALTEEVLERAADGRPVPQDLCYVRNFRDANTPTALNLPPGRGQELYEAMTRLVRDVRAAMQAAFESDDFQTQRQAIEDDFGERPESVLDEISEKAKAVGIALLRTPRGMAFAPLTASGEVMPPEEFEELPKEAREALESSLEDLQGELQRVMRQVPRWQRELLEKALDLGRQTTRLAAEEPVQAVKDTFADCPNVVEWLDAVLEDIVDLGPRSVDGGAEERKDVPTTEADAAAEAARRRYRVNVMVSHGGATRAPIVYHDNPTYADLIGRVERQVLMGALVTDHNMIRPGGLHRANGGYLMIEARRLLQQPMAYEALKRALTAQLIRIESIEQALNIVTTVQLEPEPVPLDVKVVLLGDRPVYYLLSQHDPEFDELFKVLVDWSEEVPYAELPRYAEALALLVQQEAARPFNRGAIAKVIEQSGRYADDSERLAAFGYQVRDLVREADHWALVAGRKVVGPVDVAKAIEEDERRVNRVKELALERIVRGTVFIDTAGEKVGQINGLSVMQVGKLRFGQPSRITARVAVGSGEVVNIEREVELSGPIHSKGVLILASLLRSRYARDEPLSLSAHLVFEQSYGGVDGDSASSTEFYALVSAIAGIALKQSLAVTGSVNQLGEVQPIGGVNEKIEGFFDLCNARGLTGDQGVIIPKANVPHLMLREDVVAAAKAKLFGVYPVATVDEGIELLTGEKAGAQRADGSFPEGTVNARVQQALQVMAEARRSFGESPKDDDKAENSG